MIHKKLFPLLILTFILLVSISVVSAYDGDNSTICGIDENTKILSNDIDDGNLKLENNENEVLNNDYTQDSLGNSNNTLSSITVDPIYLSETGVVSGAAELISVNPWTTSGSLNYTIPEDVENIKSAVVIVNSYSGSGNANTYALHSDVTLTTDSTVTLGSENLTYSGNQVNDQVVYVINDHTTKQYSDYQYIYNITNTVSALTPGSSLRIDVSNSKYGTYNFDGRIKMITLFLAYDDNDNDNITYWLDVGQVWTQSEQSVIMATSSYEGATDNITLQTIALSTNYANEYQVNGLTLDNINVIYKGSYYINAYWDISDSFMDGDDTEFYALADSNGWGSYKTNILLLTATEKELPGAEISLASEYISVPSIYAGVANDLTLTVVNTGGNGDNVVVSLYLDDELVASETIADYVAGETYAVNFVDPTIRPITENTVNGNNNENAVYTVVVEDGNGVINSGNFSFVIVYNGNLGKDYEYPVANPTARQFNIVGDVIVLTNGSYSSGSVTNRADVYNIEFDGNVSEALLYVSYNWDKVAGGDFNTWNATFNNQIIVPVASYRDQGNLGRYGSYGYGLVVYDVTDYVANGENTFEFGKIGGNTAVYPSSLIVLVDNPDSAVKNTVYIVEEADLLSKTYNKNLNASFTTSFDTADGNATLYVFAAGAQVGEGNLIINGETYIDVWSGTSSSFDIYSTDVEAGNISVTFDATASTILGLHQIVVVSKEVSTVNNIVIVVEDTALPDDVVVKVVADVADTYTVSIGDKTVDVVVDGTGEGTNTISLAKGKYTATTTWESDKYTANITNAKFNVYRGKASINISSDSIAYGEDLVVGITMPSDVTRRVSVTVDGSETKMVSLVNGVGSVKFSGLAVGSHAIVASYSGDNNYDKASARVTVKVNNPTPKITVSAKSITYGDDLVVNVKLPSDVSRRASVTVDGSETKMVSLVNGVGSVKFSGLAIGTHTITASYNGDSNYGKASVNTTAKVNRGPANIQVTAKPVSYGEDVVIDVKLPSDVTRRVSVTVGNQTKIVSLVNGAGSVKFSGLAVGTHAVSVEYSGDANYLKSSLNTTVKVNKATPDIQITADDINYGKTLVVGVQLPADVTKRATVTIDGVTKYASLKNGAGSVKFTGLSVGTHEIQVSYAGDANYKKASNTTTITVKK